MATEAEIPVNMFRSFDSDVILRRIAHFKIHFV